MPQETLHRIVGLVQQEPFLYSGTIMDNVRLFQEHISAEQVIWACKSVGAHHMIKRLRHGYDTRLSERGSGLSAGERQLISFARIIVMQAGKVAEQGNHGELLEQGGIYADLIQHSRQVSV